MFEGRLPARLQDLAPRVVETEEGHEVWEFDGKVFFQVGLNAVVGRKREDWKVEPTRFDEMRPGCFDIEARIRDMDINGVWASVNFPSQITGFCGSVFSRCADPELGLAVTQAWNDWFYDEWYAAHPDRIVPMGITYLADPEQGADGDPPQRGARLHRGDAARDAAPHRDGTDLLRRGGIRSSPRAQRPTPSSACTSDRPASPTCRTGAPMVPLGATLFGQLSLSACAEWLWSGYAVKHPDLKIMMSEGGIGWVAMLHDRLENIVDRSGYGDYFPGDLRPAEVLRRNFWFSTIDDPVDARDPPHDRRRPHHVRVRLSARRRDVARHPAGVRRRVRRTPGRRDREDQPRERGRAVPPSAATAGKPARDRSATVSDYETLLRDAYIGEIFGDALFGALADAQPDADRREKLRTLQTVEARTATSLRRLVEKARMKITSSEPQAREDGRKLAATLDASDWNAFVRLLHDSLPPFVEKFERLRDLGGEPVDPGVACARQPRTRHPAFCRARTGRRQALDQAAHRPPAQAGLSTAAGLSRSRTSMDGEQDLSTSIHERDFGSSLQMALQFDTNCTTVTRFPRERQFFAHTHVRCAPSGKRNASIARGRRVDRPGGGRRMQGETTLTARTARSRRQRVGAALGALLLLFVLSGCMSADQQVAWNWVKWSRAERGRTELMWNRAAQDRAQAWADYLASVGNLAHSDLHATLAATGARAAAENVGVGPSVEAVHRGLLASPGHLTNLVGPYTHVGVGVARNGDRVFVVQLFLTL